MMLNKRKYLIGLLIILALALFLYVFFGGVKGKEKEVMLKILSDKVDLFVRDFHYTEVGDPDSTWEIDADTAKYIKKDNIALFESIRVRLITSDGKIYIMSGDEGRLHTDTKNLDINGNVEITSESGDRFRTESLSYSSAEKRIYTDMAVTMENQDIKVKGVGMSLLMKDKILTLFSKVNADINNNKIMSPQERQ